MPRKMYPVAGGLLLAIGIFLVWRGIRIVPTPFHDMTSEGKAFVLNGVLAVIIVMAPAAIVIRDWVLAGRDWKRAATVPMLWALGGIFLLLLEVVFEIVSPWQEFPSGTTLGDAVYVVSHFRYVLRDCALFAFFAGFYFSFPRVTGWQYSEWLGRVHFAIGFIGVNIARMPLHVLKLERFSVPVGNMDNWIAIVRFGFIMTSVGMIVFAGVVVEALVHKRHAAALAAKGA